MAGSTITLDAPDLNVRRIMQKRRDGAPLSDRDYNRLAQRQSVEQETARVGGTVRQSVAQPQASPMEMGRADRAADDAYKSGYEGINAEAAPAPAAAPAVAPMTNEQRADSILRRRFGTPPTKENPSMAPRTGQPAAAPMAMPSPITPSRFPRAQSGPMAMGAFTPSLKKVKPSTNLTPRTGAGPASLGLSGPSAAPMIYRSLTPRKP